MDIDDKKRALVELELILGTEQDPNIAFQKATEILLASIKPKFYAKVEGGLVQSFICNEMELLGRSIKIGVINYDTDDAEPNEIGLVQQDNGDFEEAIVHHELHISGFGVGAILDAEEVRASDFDEQVKVDQASVCY